MGLRCLLGHDFDEPELQREREEDGNEVVTTVTEVKTCARCGETQIVSENTEVTTMEQLAEEAAVGTETGDGTAGTGEPEATDSAGGAADEPSAAASSSAVDLGDADAAEEDAVIIDEGPTDAVSGEEPTADAPAATESGGTARSEEDAELLDEGADDGDGAREQAGSPETDAEEEPATGEAADGDDGVILDEETEAEAGERERGAWPDVKEAESAGEDPTPWPEQRGEDEGFSAEIDDGDADGNVEFGGGLTPEAAEAAADEDVEYVTAPESSDASAAGGADRSAVDDGAPITHGSSPDLGTASDDVTTEYYCPECEMTRSADGNSMRAGDICPECKRGYIDERPI